MAIDEDKPLELTGCYAVVVDRSPQHCGPSPQPGAPPNGRVHVEIGYSQPATNGEVVDEIIRIVTEFDPVALVIDQRSAAAPIRHARCSMRPGLKPPLPTPVNSPWPAVVGSTTPYDVSNTME
jgi:hypothetical protein